MVLNVISYIIMDTRVSQKNGPSIFKIWLGLFIKNQIENYDLPNCFMCIMMSILWRNFPPKYFAKIEDGPFF